MKNETIEHMKQQLFQQLKAQGVADVASCKELIALSEQQCDTDSIAIGHIWLAESYLSAEDKIACSRELETAKHYLNESHPSEILEKYYFIQYKLYTALYDTQTAFDYCLKSLRISEQLFENPALVDATHPYFINTVENRIVGNYGNIGINFFNHGIYEKALLYCKKALAILETLDTVNVYAECLLRLNIIVSLIRTDTPQDVMLHIHLLEKLSIEPTALKIYVDYAYVNYYLYKKNYAKIAFYVNELLHDETEVYTDRLTAVDFYIDILSPVIELKMEPQSRLLLDEAARLIHTDEIRPLLSLTKLNIIYANTFGLSDKAPALYQEYFELYLKNEALTNALKINGLETRLRLSEIETENLKAKSQIHDLEDIANYDELTGIFNRRYLGLKYGELLHMGVNLLHLAIIDIDFFKEYNDTYGHLAGDELLRKLAAHLQELLSEHMIACRYGGDEFVVLSWNRDPAVLTAYAQRVAATLHTLNATPKMSHCSKAITVSIGLGSHPFYTQADVPALFEVADKALYLAKERGRNQIVSTP